MTDIKQDLSKRQDEIDQDYDLSRSTYKAIIDINSKMLELMKDLCEGSESPRAFEVYSKLSKDTADIVDKLIDLQRKKQVVDTENVMELLKSYEQSNQMPLLEAKVIEEQFSGTVEELQRKLKNETI